MTEPQIISGSEIGQHVMSLGETAAAEGWDPVGSIAAHCTACSATLELTRGPTFTGAKLCFQKMGHALMPLNEPVVCPECEADSFRLEVSRRSFRDNVRAVLEALPACSADPAQGFRCVESGDLISDHSFRGSDDFDQMWSEVSRWIGESWGMNEDYQFDIIPDSQRQSRYIEPVNGVCHYNKDQDCLVVMFRDSSGRYWHYHEPR
ncbi:MAG: hypothetical protein ACYSX0_11115 [Planctomycetota bacterium]|jgi:hypothetical protein